MQICRAAKFEVFQLMLTGYPQRHQRTASFSSTNAAAAPNAEQPLKPNQQLLRIARSAAIAVANTPTGGVPVPPMPCSRTAGNRSPASRHDAMVPQGIPPAWYDFIDRAPGVGAMMDAKCRRPRIQSASLSVSPVRIRNA